MKTLRHIPLCAALLLAAASCTDDTFSSLGSASGEGDGRHISFTVAPPASDQIVATTRSTTAIDKEKAIYTMRIMVFAEETQSDGTTTHRLIPEEVFRHYDNSFRTVFFGDPDWDGTVTESMNTYAQNEGFTLPCLDEYIYYKYTSTEETVTDEEGNEKPVTVKTLGILTQDEYDTQSAAAAEGEEYHKLHTKQSYIWVLANMGRWEHAEINHADDNLSSLEHIETLDQLKRFYGKRKYFAKNVNRQYLPMVGTVKANSTDHAVVDYSESISKDRTDSRTYAAPKTVDMTQPTAIGQAHSILLDQILTKVRFSIEVGSWTETKEDGTQASHPYEFYFDSWTVENLPRYTYIIPHKYDIYDYVNANYYQGEFLDVMQEKMGVRGVKYMFYPNDDVSAKTTVGGDSKETLEVLHNGNGDGSYFDQDWIGVDSDCDGSIDNGDKGADGRVPNAAVYASIKDDLTGHPEVTHIEEDQDNKGTYYYSFYTYGNRRGTGQSAAKVSNLGGNNAGESYQYGYDNVSVTDTDKSGVTKTLCAPDYASFLIVKGMVRKRTSATQVEVRSVVYKIALGGNMTDDYNLYRNTCYTYHLKVNGMTQNDLEVTVNEGTATPEDDFNSSVHRRYALAVDAPHADEFDAHYDMRYIQFMSGLGDVEIQLYESETDAKYMEVYTTDGTYDPTGKTPEEIWADVNKANSGVRIKSMGQNAIAAYNADDEGHNWIKLLDGGESGKTIEGTSEKYHTGMGNADAETNWYSNVTSPVVHARYQGGEEVNLFAYVKEFTPATSGYDESTPRTRSVWLMIKNYYHGNLSNVLDILKGNPGQTFFVGDADDRDEFVEVYTFIELKQWEAVLAKKADTDLANDLLVERFEEYAWHLDPRTTGDYSADGLPWGWETIGYRDGNTSFKTHHDAHDFSDKTNNVPVGNSTNNGLTNTRAIIKNTKDLTNESGTATRSYTDRGTTTTKTEDWSHLYGHRHNDYAARYCYYKSDRSTGTISEDGNEWYLPSIEELIGTASNNVSTGGIIDKIYSKHTGFSYVEESQKQIADRTAEWNGIQASIDQNAPAYWSSTVPGNNTSSSSSVTYNCYDLARNEYDRTKSPYNVSNWNKNNFSSYFSVYYTTYALQGINMDDYNYWKDSYTFPYIIKNRIKMFWDKILNSNPNTNDATYQVIYNSESLEYSKQTQYADFASFPKRNHKARVRAVRVAPSE